MRACQPRAQRAKQKSLLFCRVDTIKPGIMGGLWQIYLPPAVTLGECAAVVLHSSRLRWRVHPCRWRANATPSASLLHRQAEGLTRPTRAGQHYAKLALLHKSLRHALNSESGGGGRVRSNAGQPHDDTAERALHLF